MSSLRPHLAWVATAALILAVPAAAEGSNLSWGLRAGMSAARFHGSHGDWVGPDYRAGVHAGVYGAMRLGSGFSLQPEIAWVSKGSSGDPQVVIAPEVWDFHLEYRIHYLEQRSIWAWSAVWASGSAAGAFASASKGDTPMACST